MKSFISLASCAIFFMVFGTLDIFAQCGLPGTPDCPTVPKKSVPKPTTKSPTVPLKTKPSKKPQTSVTNPKTKISEETTVIVAKKAGEISKSNLPGGAEMLFSYIPAGDFMMGGDKENDEKPIHKVTISRDYYIGKYEVTQEQWQAVMGSNPSSKVNCPRCPVESISWDDAQKFIDKLNAHSDKHNYRLPTEAEWEYACRAGTTGDYAGNLDSIAWYWGVNFVGVREVGTKQANAWGLYDMSGNVYEWCQDWHGNYSTDAAIDPTGTANGSARVVRGGSYAESAARQRSAARAGFAPSLRRDWLGFRVVRNTL